MKYFKNYLNYKLLKSIGEYEFKPPLFEVGCGTGETLLFLKNRGFACKGIDPSKRAIEMCKLKGLEVEQKEVFAVEERFDSIICCDVLEHIEDDKRFVQKLYTLLNQKGKIFLLVPSGKMMQDDIAFGHYRRYTKKELKQLLHENGFQTLYAETFGYPILYFTRIIMNFLTLSDDRKSPGEMLDNTLKSSYEHPFDKYWVSKIARKLSEGLSILYILLMFDYLFGWKDTGFGVICIAHRP